MPKQTKTKSSLERALTDFLEYLELEKELADQTIQNYAFYLRRFIAFAASKKVKHPKEIDQSLIKKYRRWLDQQTGPQGEELKSSTKNYHLVALRSWLKYLGKRDLKLLPPDKIELKQLPERRISYLSQEELQAFLDAPLKAKQPRMLKLRDKAILELLYSAGLRVSELAGLTRDKINLKKDRFTAGSKKKERQAFLSHAARHALEEYLDQRNDQSEFFFIRHDRASKRSTEISQISPRSIQRMVEKYAAQAGIIKQVTPHTLRHTFAAHQLLNGEDIPSVQSMLGHSSSAATKVYAEIPKKKKVS